MTRLVLEDTFLSRVVAVFRYYMLFSPAVGSNAFHYFYDWVKAEPRTLFCPLPAVPVPFLPVVRGPIRTSYIRRRDGSQPRLGVYARGGS